MIHFQPKKKKILIKSITTNVRLILISSLLLLFSCKSKNDNFTIELHENGNIKSIRVYKDKILSGESMWFYPSGILEQKVLFKNGRANGNAFYFFENGALKSHKYWRDGKLSGYITEYYNDSIGRIKAVMLLDTTGKVVDVRESN